MKEISWLMSKLWPVMLHRILSLPLVELLFLTRENLEVLLQVDWEVSFNTRWHFLLGFPLSYCEIPLL